MMTVIVVRLITTLRRRRSDSSEGSSTGTLSAASTVRFVNDNNTAIITSTNTIEQTMNINHQRRLMFSAFGPAGLIAFCIPPHDETHNATTSVKISREVVQIVLIIAVAQLFAAASSFRCVVPSGARSSCR